MGSAVDGNVEGGTIFDFSFAYREDNSFDDEVSVRNFRSATFIYVKTVFRVQWFIAFLGAFLLMHLCTFTHVLLKSLRCFW